MKRFWLGAGILAVLLACGIGVSLYMEHFHGELAEEMTAAAAAAVAGDWQESVAHITRGKMRWERGRHIAAAFYDHEPLEKLDGLFDQLAVCCQMDLEEEYVLICTEIAQMSRTLGESHSLKWWNLL